MPSGRRTKKSTATLDREIGLTAPDYSSPAHEIAQVAADALEEGRRDAHLRIISTIPPIRLGKTTYRVLYGRQGGDMTIQGPRGAFSYLVPSTSDRNVVAHNTISGKTTWYRRNANDTYTAI